MRTAFLVWDLELIIFPTLKLVEIQRILFYMPLFLLHVLCSAKKNRWFWGQSNSIVHRVLALYMTNQGLTYGSPYVFPSTARVIPVIQK